jgi:hypothetical protein
MARYIGKCSECKTLSARDFVETKAITNKYGRKVNILGRVINGFFRPASEDFECFACGAWRWNGKRVQGFVTDHKCDDRCTEAKGIRCECACGGKNHGKGLLVCLPVAA